MIKKPLVYKYFDDTANILLAEYNRSKMQNASNNIGKNREYFCANFLLRVLPPKLYIKSGEIWDSKNNKTGQLDIVILRDDAPSLEIGSDNTYLAEGVFGVIEIKSNLSKTKLIEAGNTLSKVAKLSILSGAAISMGKPLERPLRIIFAYEGASWDKIVSEIEKNNWEEIFDLICILNKGVMIKKGRILKWDDKKDFIFINSKAASLGYLYLYLVSYGNSFLGQSINLSPYFEPFDRWDD